MTRPGTQERKAMDGGSMAMAGNIHNWRSSDRRDGLPFHRQPTARPVSRPEESPVRSGVALDSTGDLRGGPPGDHGSPCPRTRIAGTACGRALRRVSLWCYEQLYGDIRDAREATATNPLIVAAVGEDQAREIANRHYRPVIDPERTGNFAADALIDAVNQRGQQ
jgi:hypothetical protein